MSRELRIGIFLGIALLIMAVFVFIVGDLGALFRKPGYPLFVSFNSAAGMEEGALVRVAGVKVGRVKRIELDGARAKVTLLLAPSFKVPMGSKATQAALGLLGEKYIEIVPGGGPGFCGPGEILEGLPPVSFDQLGTLFLSIGNEIKDLGDTLNEITGRESRENIKGIIENLSAFTADLNKLLAENKDGLGRGIQSSSQVLQNFDQRIREISRALDETIKAVRGLADENRETVRLSLDKIREVVSKMDEVVDLAKVALDKVNRGEGTLGKLVHEPALYQKAEETVAKARAVLDPVSGVRADLAFRTDYYPKSETLKGSLSMALWLSRNSLLLTQIVQDPWRDRFTYSVQGGIRRGGLVPRAGIVESEFGAGVDYLAFDDRLVLSLEGFDFNRDLNPRVRLFGRWMPFRHIYILLGLDEAVEPSRREIFFGFGIHTR